ncbi:MULTISPECIES: Tim44 domain-containing protein [unclassified Janthinobacterium]|uniref:Tim44 domain-containing protein n=1 Tax=unclassified Janthinobacterium TaxID=2610881 RepID=UPI00034A2965|nr:MULTISPECIES: Tim44-like domain-containing protein [unclassified Janthinobacterium]MEC5159164.1 putative lipid-binding transport protein (Tim44 family) [Janthinobacterium sp. CG_S6]
MNIKKFLVGATLAALSLSMLADSIARPMGGGRSIGRQSHNVSRQAPAPAPAPAAQRQAQAAAAPAAAPAAAAKPPSRWKGILGGALLGLGLGALLSHFGLGGALAGMIGSLLMLALLAGAVYLIYRLVRGKRAANDGGNRNAPFSGGFGGNNALAQGAGNTPEIGSRMQPQAFEPLMPAPSAGSMLDKPAAAAPWGVPADFDTANFLRHAKSNFIRLQAAWDKADVNDIREFTTPEVYAEMKLQLQERGAGADFTDVVSIEAELLGIETSAADYLASVKFSGAMRPAPNAAAEPFAEVWNLAKPVSGNGGWLLAGIQQLS